MVYPAFDEHPKKEKIRYLRAVDLFQDLKDNEVEEIGKQMRMVHYPSNHVFYIPDEHNEVMFLIKTGRVQLYRSSPDGRKLILSTLQSGSVFGNMSLLGQHLHNTFAQSIDECYICLMDRADMEALLFSRPIVAIRLLEMLGNRLIHLEQRYEDLAFRRISARLARLLLELTHENHSSLVTSYTHQQFADMLGTYRETITQTLKDFKQEGIVSLRRKTVEILDRDALIVYAEKTNG